MSWVTAGSHQGLPAVTPILLHALPTLAADACEPT